VGSRDNQGLGEMAIRVKNIVKLRRYWQARKVLDYSMSVEEAKEMVTEACRWVLDTELP
jgi:hypothetical protein